MTNIAMENHHVEQSTISTAMFNSYVELPEGMLKSILQSRGVLAEAFWGKNRGLSKAGGETSKRSGLR